MVVKAKSPEEIRARVRLGMYRVIIFLLLGILANVMLFNSGSMPLLTSVIALESVFILSMIWTIRLGLRLWHARSLEEKYQRNALPILRHAEKVVARNNVALEEPFEFIDEFGLDEMPLQFAE